VNRLRSWLALDAGRADSARPTGLDEFLGLSSAALQTMPVTLANARKPRTLLSRFRGFTIYNWLKAANSKGAAKKPDAAAAAPVVAPKVAKKKAAKRGRPAKKKAAKKAGAKRGRPAASGFTAKLNKLASLNDEIAKAEAGLSKLKAEFAKLKASL
jgi:hypothetical protein